MFYHRIDCFRIIVCQRQELNYHVIKTKIDMFSFKTLECLYLKVNSTSTISIKIKVTNLTFSFQSELHASSSSYSTSIASYDYNYLFDRSIIALMENVFDGFRN